MNGRDRKTGSEVAPEGRKRGIWGDSGRENCGSSRKDTPWTTRRGGELPEKASDRHRHTPIDPCKDRQSPTPAQIVRVSPPWSKIVETQVLPESPPRTMPCSGLGGPASTHQTGGSQRGRKAASCSRTALEPGERCSALRSAGGYCPSARRYAFTGGRRVARIFRIVRSTS